MYGCAVIDEERGIDGRSPDATELADELHMKRREVIFKCQQMSVPIFNGRIDKTLFVASLNAFQAGNKQATA